MRYRVIDDHRGVWPIGVACSPKPDPCVMRVFSALLGKEILDETEATRSRADYQEAA